MPLLDVEQIAGRMSVDPRTVARWIKAGLFPVIIPEGHRKLVPLDHVQMAMRARHQYGRHWVTRRLEDIRHAENA